MPRRLLPSGLALAVTVTALATTGCGRPEATSAGSSSRTSVAAAFYALEYVVGRVGGDHVDVTGLTKPGLEPHDLELTPRQVGAVVDADLVVYLKGFQPAVDDAVGQGEAAKALDASTVVQMAAEHADGGHEEHAEDEHGGDAGEGAGEHAHEGAGDPHFWLDPTRVATFATAVAKRLAAVDADHAADYTANAERLGGELAALDRDYRDGLRQCERRTFVTSHSAFGYLAERYYLQQVPIAGLSPEVEPSPGRLEEVQDVVRSEDVTTIFYETLTAPDVAESMARDLGVRTDVLDPVEGITDASPGRDYLAVMRANLDALRKANGCA